MTPPTAGTIVFAGPNVNLQDYTARREQAPALHRHSAIYNCSRNFFTSFRFFSTMDFACFALASQV